MKRSLVIIFGTTLLIVFYISGLALGKDKAKSLEDLVCNAGQIPKFDGTDWVCADDADTADTSAATQCGTDELLDGDGQCVPIPTDTDTSAETQCPDGHALLGDGSCADLGQLQDRISQIEALLGIACPCFTASQINAYYEAGWPHPDRTCDDSGELLHFPKYDSTWTELATQGPSPIDSPRIAVSHCGGYDPCVSPANKCEWWNAETGDPSVVMEVTLIQYNRCRQEILNSNLWNTCTQ
jgi:hypothetical protein